MKMLAVMLINASPCQFFIVFYPPASTLVSSPLLSLGGEPLWMGCLRGSACAQHQLQQVLLQEQNSWKHESTPTTFGPPRHLLASSRCWGNVDTEEHAQLPVPSSSCPSSQLEVSSYLPAHSLMLRPCKPEKSLTVLHARITSALIDSPVCFEPFLSLQEQLRKDPMEVLTTVGILRSPSGKARESLQTMTSAS